MPIYVYRCNACQCEYEIKQGMTDKPIKKCPSCKKNKCERLICEPTIIDLTPKTIGGLADKNTREMGQYARDAKQEQAEKDKEAALKQMGKPVKKPFYKQPGAATTREIQKMSPEKRKKYIFEGKK